MTYQTYQTNQMRSPSRAARTAALLFITAAILMTPTGCNDSEQQQAAAPAPVATAPAPRVDPLDNLDMDPRVQFPQSRTPQTKAFAQAVATLATAIATGDADQMDAMLDPSASAVLEKLLSNGGWSEQTAGVETVRIVAIEEAADTGKVALAIQDPAGAYALAWDAKNVGGQWLFTGLKLAEDNLIASRASEFDGLILSEASLPELLPEPAPLPDAADDDVKKKTRAKKRSGKKRKSTNLPNRRNPLRPG